MSRGFPAEVANRIAALALALLAFAAGAQPQERVELYLFWGAGCPHCEREIDFLKRLEAEEPRCGCATSRRRAWR